MRCVLCDGWWGGGLQAYGRPDSIGDVRLVDYVFNGDFVDRGPHSLDVALLLLALKLLQPRHVFLIRGNHESRVVNEMYGFWVRGRQADLQPSPACRPVCA